MGKHRFTLFLAVALVIVCVPLIGETPANIIASLKKYTPEEFESLRKLAKNDPQAQNALGLAYLTQTRVAQDYEEAYQLFHKAARRGYGPAQNNLAYCTRTALVCRLTCSKPSCGCAGRRKTARFSRRSIGTRISPGLGSSRITRKRQNGSR